MMRVNLAPRRDLRGAHRERLVTAHGRTLSLAAWCREPESIVLRLTPELIRNRLRLGWAPELALGTPLPHARANELTRFADDPEAQRFVAEHPHGADREEIAAVFGVTRERIRQIEVIALRRLAKRLSLVGVSMQDLAEHFAQKRDSNDYSEVGS